MLTLLVTAVVATIAFPIVAGVLRFGMPPGTTGFRSLMLWAGYTFGDKGQPAHWFAFWANLKLHLAGTAPNPARLKTIEATLVLAGLIGTASALVAAYRLWIARPAQPAVARRHMRGTTLIAHTDMPAFVAGGTSRFVIWTAAVGTNGQQKPERCRKVY